MRRTSQSKICTMSRNMQQNLLHKNIFVQVPFLGPSQSSQCEMLAMARQFLIMAVSDFREHHQYSQNTTHILCLTVTIPHRQGCNARTRCHLIESANLCTLQSRPLSLDSYFLFSLSLLNGRIDKGRTHTKQTLLHRSWPLPSVGP